jgi:hypothetical protein
VTLCGVIGVLLAGSGVTVAASVAGTLVSDGVIAVCVALGTISVWVAVSASVAVAGKLTSVGSGAGLNDLALEKSTSATISRAASRTMIAIHSA